MYLRSFQICGGRKLTDTYSPLLIGFSLSLVLAMEPIATHCPVCLMQRLPWTNRLLMSMQGIY
jgi:hypothetical protein